MNDFYFFGRGVRQIDNLSLVERSPIVDSDNNGSFSRFLTST